MSGLREGRAVSAAFSDPLTPGTWVLAWPGSREGEPLVTRTRSEVWAVHSGERVVAVEGYAGGIALTHVDVLPVAEDETPATPDDDRLREIDRNARAYGWEVGRHGTLHEVIEHTCPNNPFLDPDWRERIDRTTEPATPDDLETLAEVVLPALPNHCCDPGDLTDCPYDAHDAGGIARAVLASDWLADRLAAARREAADAALTPVEALHDTHHWCQDADGVSDFFMVDGETGSPWPCPTLLAIAQGRDAAKGGAR